MAGAESRFKGLVDGVKSVDAEVDAEVVPVVVAAEAGTAAPNPKSNAANPLNKVTRKVRFIISTP